MYDVDVREQGLRDAVRSHVLRMRAAFNGLRSGDLDRIEAAIAEIGDSVQDLSIAVEEANRAADRSAT